MPAPPRPPDDAATAPRLDSALEFARRAGELTLRYFGGSSFETERKRDGSEVTTADREAEQLLRALIAEDFPEDGILGEEFGEKPARGGWRWILDPIDGTASFVHGVPLYGTLVACEFEGRTRAGVIHMPALGETVYAREGGGVWHIPAGGCEPRRVRVSQTEALGDAMVCTTSYAYFRQAGLEGAFLPLLEQSGGSRGWSDCYAHVLCATGRIDAVVEPVLKPWDIAPMQVIYAEAGGRTSDWSGRPGAYNPNGVASNGRIHDELLALLGPFLG